jgi:predicted aspartyl protease
VFRAKDCGGTMLTYWAQTNSIGEMEIEATHPLAPHLIGQAKLNGKRIRVVFDTGA